MKTSRFAFSVRSRAQNSRRKTRHWGVSRSDATNDFFSRKPEPMQRALDGRTAGRDPGFLSQRHGQLFYGGVRHRRHDRGQQRRDSPMDWRRLPATLRQWIHTFGLTVTRQHTIDGRVANVQQVRSRLVRQPLLLDRANDRLADLDGYGHVRTRSRRPDHINWVQR